MLQRLTTFTGHFNIAVDCIDDEDDELDSIFVYDFKELLQNQIGFCIDEKLQPYKDMRQNMVAIADVKHDFYCIDCSKENSPVYYAMHGMGDWEFDVVYETLAEFIDALIVYKD